MDALTLTGLLYAAWTPQTKYNSTMLVASCLLTVMTAGFTNRWPLTLPMIPVLTLQAIRRIPALSGQWIGWTIAILSTFIIMFSGVLSVLFPALELPPIDGPYHVGVVDLFLPVDMTAGLSQMLVKDSGVCTHISVRILYPTLDRPEGIPYLNPRTAAAFCRETMKFGAPFAIKEFGWILHTWRLTGLRVKRNAALLPKTALPELPVVAFSHGLGGSADMYSYQTMALAAHGAVVLSVNHQDGSNPVVEKADGSVMTFDHDIAQLWKDEKHAEYVRARRSKTELRTQELIASTEALLRLNEKDLLEFHRHGLSFRQRLQIDLTFFMGHSFGGATALTAAKRRPDLAKAVIAHEPAIDWMPDDIRRSFFADDRMKGLSFEFSGGTGGYMDEGTNEDMKTSIHNVDILVLSSNEWKDKEWGSVHIIEDMHRAGRLGIENGNSIFGVIDGAHHTEFSDSSILMPLWLARATGVTGQRNPIDTAKEIAQETRAFIERVRKIG
jgi:platelet-activating factor acetylhydrolase